MGTHPLIYIRADGNPHIASGHLMRCLSIAMACGQLGMSIHFLVSDEESLSLLKELSGFSDSENNYAFSQLQTASYNHLEQELPEVSGFLSAHKHDTNVISDGTAGANPKPVYFLDSYYVTPNYLDALRPYAKIVYLDDLRLFDYSVDLLVNYDVIPDSAMASYKASYQNAGRLLLGAAYTPLRPQFQDRQIAIKNQVKNILIATGGSDPCHFCLAFLRHLESRSLTDLFLSSGIILHMVIGNLNTDGNLLHKYADAFPFLELHEKISDMASLMLRCDLAISAAGTTLYELCALGIPSVSFTIADNQLTAASAFEAVGAVPCAGDFRGNPKKVLFHIIHFLEGSSYEKRKNTHKVMRGLVDGLGAMRIAQALKKL